MTALATDNTMRKAAGRRTSLAVTVLAGGPGPEREVSLESGAAVHAALSRLGHNALLRDISPDDLSALDEAADFVFIALHGEFGEDGSLQAELDRRGLMYSGCGAEASRLAMNKVAAKKRFETAGVPTPRYAVVAGGFAARELETVGVPAVVKPVSSGSSVDTSIIRDAAALRGVADQVARKYGEALVEQYIKGPELTVGVLGDMALPVCEIRTTREFYDYHAKYIDDSTQYLFDLDLPADLLKRVQDIGLAAHRSLGCRAFSRVDVMVDGATMRPFVLEVNTIPGMTSHSLLPKGAARIGLDFDQLCQRMIDLSLA